jgi:hypothetical protein
MKSLLLRATGVAGAGVKDTKDAPSVTRTIVRGLMKLIAAKVLQDSEKSFEFIKNSGLDWTICRVPILVDNGGYNGNLMGDYIPTKPLKMNRSSIARWMVEEAANKQFIHQAPFLKPTEG